MARSSQKPRKKLDPKKYSLVPEQRVTKERDWTFEDILRSKYRKR